MARAKHNIRLSPAKTTEFSRKILKWYDRHRRTLPWRAARRQKPDPYHVWLSEIMLQQTTVTAVMPYYMKFLKKWPTVKKLAAAPEAEVMREWAGLGYYARARNLHACAKVVAKDFKGAFPQDQEALKKLPGIGDYTSAAIRAIAFNKPATVVDGNVERVMARYCAVTQNLPDAKPALKALAGEFFAECADRPGDFAQALMDLGATICIPGKPRCSLCPVNDSCTARKKNIQDSLPARAAKKAKPRRTGHVYWITDAKGRVLVQKRPAKGLLGGMMALPTSEWIAHKDRQLIAAPKPLAPLKLKPHGKKPASVRHVFTHFDLELLLHRAPAPKTFKAPPGHSWAPPDSLEDIGFPSLFRKAFKLYRAQGIIK